MAEPASAKALVSSVPTTNMNNQTDVSPPRIPLEVFAHVAKHLIYQRAFRSCANLNVTSHSVYATTLSVLWRTVWMSQEKMQWMISPLGKKGKGMKHVQYLIYPDFMGDPQGLCIAAIKRSLTPKACIVGPVYLPGQAPEEGATPGNSKRIIVHIFDSFYARGSGDLIELWEAIGLLSGRTPQRGHFDGMNVNLVVQVHSERVVEEWNQGYEPLTERPTNLDPLRFQKFDFHQGHTLRFSSRIETFLAHLGQIQGMQASSSNAGALMLGNSMEDQIMAAYYCQEMRFFGCNQHNMQIVLRALEKAFQSCRFNCLGAFEIHLQPHPPLPTTVLKGFLYALLQQLQPLFTAAFDQAWLGRTMVVRRGLRIWCEPDRKLMGFLRIERNFRTVATIMEEGQGVIYEKACAL